jgi:hypothetical protein
VARDDAARPRSTVRRVYLVWVLGYAIVGGEVAWACAHSSAASAHSFRWSFFVGTLHGNVYEFIGRDIAPYLWSRAARGLADDRIDRHRHP